MCFSSVNLSLAELQEDGLRIRLQVLAKACGHVKNVGGHHFFVFKPVDEDEEAEFTLLSKSAQKRLFKEFLDDAYQNDKSLHQRVNKQVDAKYKQSGLDLLTWGHVKEQFECNRRHIELCKRFIEREVEIFNEPNRKRRLELIKQSIGDDVLEGEVLEMNSLLQMEPKDSIGYYFERLSAGRQEELLANFLRQSLMFALHLDKLGFEEGWADLTWSSKMEKLASNSSTYYSLIAVNSTCMHDQRHSIWKKRR